MGIIPFGNKLRDYFLRYQSSQSHINAIINALYKGQDELRKDNAAIEQEKVNLWDLMTQLQQYVYVGKKIDSALESRLAEFEASDPEKAAWSAKRCCLCPPEGAGPADPAGGEHPGLPGAGYGSQEQPGADQGVDRATTTTVSALRTAVIVAQALANQKLVLDQITALNTTTGNLIRSTSQLLRKQTVDIQQQAASATVNIEQLQRAFENIYCLDGYDLRIQNRSPGEHAPDGGYSFNRG